VSGEYHPLQVPGYKFQGLPVLPSAYNFRLPVTCNLKPATATPITDNHPKKVYHHFRDSLPLTVI